MSRLLMFGVMVTVATAADVSLGFTQKEVKTGHDRITWFAALAAGGPFAEPGSVQVGKDSALCGWNCDQYDTKNWKTWSAVMGNRWTDIGGFNAGEEVARAQARRNNRIAGLAWKTNCWEATMQDNDDVQYAHALRKIRDVGLPGLQRTHDGTVQFIHQRFLDGAVNSPEVKMWFRDGGNSVDIRWANRPYFLLGMALHALQDSFSEEHTSRNPNNWHQLWDYKTYVGTPGVAQHATPKTQPYKFAPGAVLMGSVWAAISPTALNGDYIFTDMTSYKLKPSAQAALEASRDLMLAFEAARQTPRRAEAIWNDFKSRWLQLDPHPGPAQPPGVADAKDTDQVRDFCLRNDAGGREAALPDIAYPPFCYPADKCR